MMAADCDAVIIVVATRAFSIGVGDGQPEGGFGIRMPCCWDLGKPSNSVVFRCLDEVVFPSVVEEEWEAGIVRKWFCDIHTHIK